MKTTNLYEEAGRRLMELKKIQEEKEVALRKAPPGRIHIVKSTKRVQYYLRMDPSDKSGRYLSKAESITIKKYVQKTYDEKILKAVNKEIENLALFLNNSKDCINTIQQVYSSEPNSIKQYIEPTDCSDEDYLKYWLSIPYEKKPMPELAPDYITDRGEKVRSKSEINIANTLLKYDVPYKYECPLKLMSGEVIYPDFTILDVTRRRIVYWEHRGMMDDEDYAKHSVARIKEYMRNGIYLGENLIITEETVTCPMGTREIQDVIQHYFTKIRM